VRAARALRRAGLVRPTAALTQQGSHDEALATLAEGFELIEATGERVWQAELHRIHGLALLAQYHLDEGQVSLQQAIRIAQIQQAKSLELRAATSLALRSRPALT
jgi:predicted ATPase